MLSSDQRTMVTGRTSELSPRRNLTKIMPAMPLEHSGWKGFNPFVRPNLMFDWRSSTGPVVNLHITEVIPNFFQDFLFTAPDEKIIRANSGQRLKNLMTGIEIAPSSLSYW